MSESNNTAGARGSSLMSALLGRWTIRIAVKHNTVPLTRTTDLLSRRIFFAYQSMPFLIFLFSELTKIIA